MPDDVSHRADHNSHFQIEPANDAGGAAKDSLEAILAEQRLDWMTGRRIPAADRLRQHPAVAANPVQGAELVYHEFALRQELGESPDWRDYLRQFPQYATALRLLAQADRMVEQALPAAPEVKPCLPQIRGYELLDELGQGGMGILYKARHKSLDRLVALKMIRAGEYAGDAERKRFRREAQAVARLQHPNIVQIYEVGETQGQPFLAFEFVDGPSLAHHLDGTPLPARQAASLLEMLARAMHHAHGQGIIHRDLKPSNVLLTATPEAGSEGCVPKITDFGLAKRLDRGRDTGSGVVQGTPSYMAAEQAEGRTAAIDQRTDVYGLGTILYEALTGRPPFRAESPLQTLKQVTEAEPASPRLLNPVVPRDLETICLKCLEKDRGRRYASAEALGNDLHRFLIGEPIQARPVGAGERAWRWSCRNPVIAGLAAALVLAVLGGFSATWVQWRRAEANVTREKAAHREAEENYRRLRDIVVKNIYLGATRVITAEDLNPMRQMMLQDASDCLAFFLQRSDRDVELQTLLAVVLTQQGEMLLWQDRYGEARDALERADRLWKQLPPREAGNGWRPIGPMITYFYLEQVYEQQGDPESAQQAFAAGFDLWRVVKTEVPGPPREQYNGIGPWIDLARVLIRRKGSEKEVARRLNDIDQRLKRIGGGPEGALLLDVLTVQALCTVAENHQKAGQPAGLLAAAREAASILWRLLQRVSLHRHTRCHLAHTSLQVSLLLRRAQAPDEALRVSVQANRTLQGVLAEAPDAPYALRLMGMSWHEIGNIHWSLRHSEDTLVAYRNALGAQRRLVAVAPGEAEYRRELGTRYGELGRRLCELGRLDEAERCFLDRQAVWPGDAAKQAEALQDLQAWAARVGAGKENLSAEEQQERQRYLDLYARLERDDGTGAGPQGSDKRGPSQ